MSDRVDLSGHQPVRVVDFSDEELAKVAKSWRFGCAEATAELAELEAGRKANRMYLMIHFDDEVAHLPACAMTVDRARVDRLLNALVE